MMICLQDSKRRRQQGTCSQFLASKACTTGLLLQSWSAFFPSTAKPTTAKLECIYSSEEAVAAAACFDEAAARRRDDAAASCSLRRLHAHSASVHYALRRSCRVPAVAVVSQCSQWDERRAQW